MTERAGRHAIRTADTYVLGPSRVCWEGNDLILTLDERCAPLPQALTGTITVHAGAHPATIFDLTGNGRHHWQPIAPASRVSVDLATPALKWSGNAYLDSNWGSEPLEDGFQQWDWARFATDDGCIVAYDMVPQTGDQRSLGVHFGADASVNDVSLPGAMPLGRTIWGLNQTSRCDPGHSLRRLASFEDVPFYSRNHIQSVINDQTLSGVHETFNGQRLRKQWVKALLPFRMPRVG